MSLEGLLATESLLTMMVGLMSVGNIISNKVRSHLSSLTKYFKRDILIRNRLERKADFLLSKMNVDLSQFENTAQDLKELEELD